MNQLNIFTNAFDTHSCLNSPPKLFKWVFNQFPNEGLPVVYFDNSIFSNINDGYTGPKYGWLGESTEIIKFLIHQASQHKNELKKYYKCIFTNDRRLIELDQEFFKYNPPASNMPWVTKYGLYPKSKLCSYITSFKQFTSGHQKRMELFEILKNNPTFSDHIFGRDYRNLPDKLDGLRDYMFSVVVENSIYPKYYTEKVTDCFATGTVPIYYGDRSILEDYDGKGIIFLEDLSSFDDLNKELYEKCLPHIQTNYLKVNEQLSADDAIYRSIIND